MAGNGKSLATPRACYRDLANGIGSEGGRTPGQLRPSSGASCSAAPRTSFGFTLCIALRSLARQLMNTHDLFESLFGRPARQPVMVLALRGQGTIWPVPPGSTRAQHTLGPPLIRPEEDENRARKKSTGHRKRSSFPTGSTARPCCLHG